MKKMSRRELKKALSSQKAGWCKFCSQGRHPYCVVLKSSFSHCRCTCRTK